MKRMISIISAAAVCAAALTLGGCSDFSFNPIGKWTLDKTVVRWKDNIIDTAKYDENTMSLVFGKSGTGTKKMLGDSSLDKSFAFETEDTTVRVSYKNFAENDDSIEIYQLSDDGKSLVTVVIEPTFVDKEAKLTFDPSGSWYFTDDNLYSEDTLVKSSSYDTDSSFVTYALIMNDDDTGCLRRDGSEDRYFKYKYDDKYLTVTFDKPEEGQEASVKYEFIEEKTQLRRVQDTAVQDEDGHELKLREEFIFRHVIDLRRESFFVKK